MEKFYIVQCKGKGSRQRWKDYSGIYKDRAAAEACKIHGESVKALTVNGEEIIFRIIEKEAAPSEAQERPENAPRTPSAISTGENTTDGEKDQETQKIYKYGMKYRGFSIGAQPAGVIAREDDPTGIYYDIIIYNKPLTPEQIASYELQPIITQDQPGGGSEKLLETAAASVAAESGTPESPRTDEKPEADKTTTSTKEAPQKATQPPKKATDGAPAERPPEAPQSAGKSKAAQTTTRSDAKPQSATETAKKTAAASAKTTGPGKAATAPGKGPPPESKLFLKTP